MIFFSEKEFCLGILAFALALCYLRAINISKRKDL